MPFHVSLSTYFFTQMLNFRQINLVLLSIAISAIISGAAQQFLSVQISGGNASKELWLFLNILQPYSLNIGTQSTTVISWDNLAVVFLIIGLIQYYQSKGNLFRLLGFSIAVLLINQFAMVLSTGFNTIYFSFTEDFKEYRPGFLITFLNLLVRIAYIFATYKILKSLENGREPAISVHVNGTTVTDTPKVQRLIHWLIDGVLIVLIFSQFVAALAFILSDNEVFQRYFNNRFTLLIFIFFARLIFYPWVEQRFGVSPAKYLTASRVVDEKLQNISMKQSLSRTVSRSIPFDAVSFFWKRGWHDSISSTYVIRLKNDGLNSWFFALITLLAALVPAYHYFGRDYITSLKSERVLEKRRTFEDEWLKHSKKIKTGQIFGLDPADYKPGNKSTALKIEKISGDSATVKQITVHMGTDYFANYNAYLQQKDTAQVHKVRIKDLAELIPENTEEIYRKSPVTKDLLNKGRVYRFEYVYELGVPFLDDAHGPDFMEERMRNHNMAIVANAGTEGKIISITTVEGTVEWTDRFPIHLPAAVPMERNSIKLNTRNREDSKSHLAEVTVEDSSGYRQMYMLELNGGAVELTRVK